MTLPKAYLLLEAPFHPVKADAALTSWAPNEFYRYAYKQGMKGWDVWALQVALNSNYLGAAGLTEDGDFGPITNNAVLRVQTALKVTVDGICGPQTMAAWLKGQSKVAEKGLCPAGLVRGQAEGESGDIIPATSPEYFPGNRDYGPWQDNQTNASQATLHNCFNLAYESHKVASFNNAQYKAYIGKAGAPTNEQAWHLAVLHYNWPAAADQIAAGKGNTWVYTSNGQQYKMSDPAPWIQQFKISGVNTGWDWCAFYIDTKVMYVTNWDVIA